MGSIDWARERLAKPELCGPGDCGTNPQRVGMVYKFLLDHSSKRPQTALFRLRWSADWERSTTLACLGCAQGDCIALTVSLQRRVPRRRPLNQSGGNQTAGACRPLTYPFEWLPTLHQRCFAFIGWGSLFCLTGVTCLLQGDRLL